MAPKGKTRAHALQDKVDAALARGDDSAAHLHGEELHRELFGAMNLRGQESGVRSQGSEGGDDGQLNHEQLMAAAMAEFLVSLDADSPEARAKFQKLYNGM